MLEGESQGSKTEDAAASYRHARIYDNRAIPPTHSSSKICMFVCVIMYIWYSDHVFMCSCWGSDLWSLGESLGEWLRIWDSERELLKMGEEWKITKIRDSEGRVAENRGDCDFKNHHHCTKHRSISHSQEMLKSVDADCSHCTLISRTSGLPPSSVFDVCSVLNHPLQQSWSGHFTLHQLPLIVCNIHILPIFSFMFVNLGCIIRADSDWLVGLLVSVKKKLPLTVIIMGRG